MSDIRHNHVAVMAEAEGTTLDSEQRAQLVDMLRKRAGLLRPSDDLVRHALRRCVRYDLRTGRVPEAREPARSGQEAGAAAGAVEAEAAEAAEVAQSTEGSDAAEGP